MREIKFRFWDKSALYQVEELHRTWVAVGVQISEDEAQLEQRLIADGALMQFTGLHDKNRKEIYEGDIVALRDKLLTKVEPFAVEWDNMKSRYDFAGLRTNLSWEVIGNIYEDPELLKL